ncbi:MAG: Mu transposase C-terminal domain-containing protein [Clostridium butyricum]
MKSNEIRKYMLLIKEHEDTRCIYRILDITEEQALVIDCIKKNMPVWKNFDFFNDFIEFEEEVEIDVFNTLENMNSEERKIAYQRYNMISGIIPFIANEKMRTEAINKSAELNGITKQTVRKYLCEYLASMDVKSLVPKKQRDSKRPLTKDEKNIRKSLNKWYYTTKKRTLKSVYNLMLKNFYCNAEGILLENYPSYYQFRYFYRKYNKKQTEYISRNGLSYYQRNQRPLTGDGVQAFAPAIGTGMLDSTVCDIYLVNHAGLIIGRPVLTFCIDAYSGLVCGYSLSWEGGIYSLRDLMLNVISDKVEHCRKFGIQITKEDWSCHQLPLKLITDMGSEYKGGNFEQITDLGVELINLQSYRAEQKSKVEKSFDVIQGYFKLQLKGKGVIETDFQERGVHDYRKDACLTMNDFEKIILHCIIFYNSKRVIESFPLTDTMLEAEVKPIPIHIWNWGCKQPGANLIEVSKEELIKTLLPRILGKFSRFGLCVNGLHYHNKLYKEEYLRGNKCDVAFDPDSTDRVWVIENGVYIQFNLIESRFRDKTLDNVQSMKNKQKDLVKREQKGKTQAEIDLIRHIDTIADSASNSIKPSIKNIRNNRKQEQVKEHKHHAKEVMNNVQE